MDKATADRLLSLKDKVACKFDAGDWAEVGLISGYSNIIDGHHRLLRSLSWNDADYEGNVLEVMKGIASVDPNALDVFEDLLNRKYPETREGIYISSKPSAKKVTFAPQVFQIPDVPVRNDLVAVMMPFSAEFNPVYKAIKAACEDCFYDCLRADDIWQEATIIQDVFNLIFQSRIVICDFSGRNPNVMYETGIAHTLGKIVIPISQSLGDVPFDMKHHRVLTYHPNDQGFDDLRRKLISKLETKP